MRELVRSNKISLIGFDDFELADMLTPPVSVVARINGDDRTEQLITFPADLVQRRSGELPLPADVT